MASHFIATKVRSNRPGWSVTFRHPVRTDSKNKKGLKVRKGLGTADDARADELVNQLNTLLADEAWWSADKRKDAAHLFDPIVVSIFFEGMESGSFDSVARRDQIIPLPSAIDGYSRAMLLGTTGAGKTTLLRHFIGSDHESDRFPSTSTAKTTTADTEIVTSEGHFEAVVTFMPEYQVRAYVDECLEAACLEAVQGSSPTKIMAALLQHEEQRFRLSYVLGGWSSPQSRTNDDEFLFDDESTEGAEIAAAEIVSGKEQEENRARLDQYLSAIGAVVSGVEARVKQELGELRSEVSADDRRPARCPPSRPATACSTSSSATATWWRSTATSSPSRSTRRERSGWWIVSWRGCEALCSSRALTAPYSATTIMAWLACCLRSNLQCSSAPAGATCKNFRQRSGAKSARRCSKRNSATTRPAPSR